MKRKVKEINRNLSLPDVNTVDNVKQFPRYSSILTRQDGEGVGIEEIDSLQTEIETLLGNALQRARAFQVELMVLENKTIDVTDFSISKPKPKVATVPSVAACTSAANTSISPIPPIIEQNLQQTPNAKRFKSSSNLQQRPSSTFTCNPDENSLIVRNDISEIFWNMVQPYCTEISDEDVKFLKEQIELNSRIQSNFGKEMSTLGRHYTVKWAEDDVGGEIKESSRLNIEVNGTVPHTDRRRKNFSNFLNEIDAFQTSTDSETSQYGPLTQRLISALVEQNLMTPFNTNLTDFEMMNDEKSKSTKNHDTATSSNHLASNSNLFESKIRDELIEQGILDKNDLDLDDAKKNGEHGSELDHKDEIVEEIKKLQNELLLVSDKCKDAQIELLQNAKQVMAQQSLRKKIDQCDLKIQEFYAKSVLLKQSKKFFPRKEKDKLSELIKERDTLKQQMSQIVIPNFAYAHSV